MSLDKSKERFTVYRRSRREKRKELLDVYKEVISGSKLKDSGLGFQCFRIDEITKEVYRLPTEFAYLFKACEEFIDNPHRFPSLLAYGGHGITRRDIREKVARVMCVLLARTQVIEGHIGRTTPGGIRPVSYYSLVNDYVLRFGEWIEESSFHVFKEYLVRAGFLMCQDVTARISSGFESVIRSAAAYKQFTNEFFRELKVTTYKDVANFVLKTREREYKKGLRFKWISFLQLIDELAKAVNAIKLNDALPVAFHDHVFSSQRPSGPPH